MDFNGEDFERGWILIVYHNKRLFIIWKGGVWEGLNKKLNFFVNCSINFNYEKNTYIKYSKTDETYIYVAS